MAKGKKTVEQTLKAYLWLLGSLYIAGDDGLTLTEVNELWQDNELSGGRPMPRDTFIKRRKGIWETFNIAIRYSRKTNKYSIDFSNDMGMEAANREMVHSIALRNFIADNIYLDERILFDSFKREKKYLLPIIKAIRDQVFVIIWFTAAGKKKKWVFKPLFLKSQWSNWYVIGYTYDNGRKVTKDITLNAITEIAFTDKKIVDDYENMNDYLIMRPTIYRR